MGNIQSCARKNDIKYRFLYFLNSIWQDKIPPESWKKALIVPLHKKGDTKKCENYRGISLLNSGYKIYGNIIKNKLYVYYKGKLGEEQNGFRRGRSCSDGYFSLKLIIEKHREFNIETHLAFIDHEKVFDNVNKNTLLDILAADNVPDQIIHAIYNIYSNNNITIKTDSHPSKWESINKGVRQGCGLSPPLFIIYMDAIIKRWRGGNYGGISINRSMSLDNLLFADDQVLIASSEDELQRAIYNLQNTVSDFDMSISIEKTKIMAFSGKDPVKSKICINNKTLEQVNT
jgi:hypothetical protein